ncbi:sensor histidine kinase [Sediminitomix flava]|uniref:histidine kinase n=1 Tax=Sediminitomix flava TaxID=379075 RepID=A0A315Z5Y6_SEDFL|nr:HAMP domain-containing sensor histidine kinase [Sediminitomix flava]PWJ39122.1 signal transduction histidine kinase [Sediminitomix flava]
MNLEDQYFLDTKNKLLNRLLKLSTILGYVGLAASLSRYFELGWLGVMNVHLVVMAILTTLSLCTKRLSYNLKGIILVTLFYITGIVGIGHVYSKGNGLLFLISFSVLSAVLFGKRGSYISIGITLISLLSLTGLSFLKVSPFDLIYTETSKSFWLTSIASFVICVSTVSYAINFIYEHLQNSVSDLTENNRQLVKTNNELDNFVYRVSHDLRAPLLSIKGLIELHSNEQNTKQSKIYLDLEKKSINKLDEFIINIIEYSRNTRASLNLKVLNFKNVINEVIAPLTINYPKVIHKVFINIDQPFYTDTFRINVILNNLLSNAFRFSSNFTDTPRVHVHLEEKKDVFMIRVSDNGPGILPEHQSKVFDIFYRATDTSHGSGIGLYIAQEATEKLGGKIYLNSSPSQGCTFIVELPKYSEYLKNE